MKIEKLIPSKLSYFMKVYKELNYKKAAELIPITRQGLMRSIKNLENDLDEKLFLESGDDLIPTKAGKELFELVSKWQEDAEALKTIGDDKKEPKSKLKLYGASGSTTLLGKDFIERFERENPKLILDYTEESDFQVDEALKSKLVNVAITASPFDNDLFTIELVKISVIAIISKNNILSQKEYITIKDLKDQNLAITDKGCKLNKQLKNELEDANISPESMWETREIFNLPNFVKENNGIGIVTSHIAKTFNLEPDLVCIPIKNVERSFGFSKVTEYELSPEEKTLKNFTQETININSFNRLL